LAWKCCATCFLTKPTIAGRCVCSRISSDSRCRMGWRTGSGIGKSCGKSAGRLAAPATILKESLRAQAARDGPRWWRHRAPAVRGWCRSSGRRWHRSEAGARIPCVGGRCRHVARAITTHPSDCGRLTAYPEGERCYVDFVSTDPTAFPRNALRASRRQAPTPPADTAKGDSQALRRWGRAAPNETATWIGSESAVRADPPSKHSYS
jgi:hypothetical protein